MHLLWNDGSPGALTVTHERLFDLLPRGLLMEDFEESGQRSLLVSLSAMPTRHITFGGPGGPRSHQLHLLPVANGSPGMEWIDMNGDGRGDLVYINSTRTEVRVDLGTGWPVFQHLSALAVQNVDTLLVGDADGDALSRGAGWRTTIQPAEPLEALS